jgi:hypothetical protein
MLIFYEKFPPEPRASGVGGGRLQLFVSMLALLALLPVAAAVAAPPAFPACCAYGGSGSAVLLGAGVLNAFSPPRGTSGPPAGPNYAAPMAVGVSAEHSFTTILFAAASGPEDAKAGWTVTSNATNDVIFVYSNVSATEGPTCSAGVAPRGAMVGTYALCGGAGGLFPQHVRDYQLTPATRVGVFQQTTAGGEVSSTLALADAEACAPVSLMGSYSPFGTGAFSIQFESGVAAEPPQTWSQPPSWCTGRWQWAPAGELPKGL